MDIFKNSKWEKINSIIFHVTLLFVISAVSIHLNIIDVDLWARLLQGKYVIQNLHPMYQDITSYAPTHTWYDPEWLSSAFLYLIADNFGVLGLIFSKCVILSAFFSILVVCANKINPSTNHNNIIFILLPILCLFPYDFFSSTIRCQLITYILFTIWFFILESSRKGNNKLLYLTPLIMLFWLNTHGGCIAGMGLLLIYALGEFLNKKPFKKYLLIFIICGLCFLINPWGLEYVKFIFDSAFLDRSLIAEWKGFFEFGKFYKYCFFYYMTIVLFSYIFQLYKKKETIQTLDKTKFLIILTLLYLSISHIKHISLCVITFSLFLFEDFKNTFKFLLPKIEMFYIKVIELCLFTILITLSLWQIIKFCNLPLIKKISLDILPIIQMEFLKKNEFKGNVLSIYHTNSFIAYKYGKNFKIFIDGRYEQLYKKEVLNKSSEFDTYANKNAIKILEDYTHDFVITQKGSLINDYMKEENKNYFLINQDCTFSLYALKKYENIHTTPTSVDINKYLETIFDTELDFSKK